MCVVIQSVIAAPHHSASPTPDETKSTPDAEPSGEVDARRHALAGKGDILVSVIRDWIDAGCPGKPRQDAPEPFADEHVFAVTCAFAARKKRPPSRDLASIPLWLLEGR